MIIFCFRKPDVWETFRFDLKCIRRRRSSNIEVPGFGIFLFSTGFQLQQPRGSAEERGTSRVTLGWTEIQLWSGRVVSGAGRGWATFWVFVQLPFTFLVSPQPYKDEEEEEEGKRTICMLIRCLCLELKRAVCLEDGQNLYFFPKLWNFLGLSMIWLRSTSRTQFLWDWNTNFSCQENTWKDSNRQRLSWRERWLKML